MEMGITMKNNDVYIPESKIISGTKEALTNEDGDEFVEIALRATKHMGDITNALGRSDKAIAALNYEYVYLNQFIGKEVGLKHIYSGKIHVGILESLDNKTATLKVPVTAARNGYQYRCVITDKYGNVINSNAATLTVKK